MVVDETLAEDPELLRAAVSATLLAIEDGSLEHELRASRARIVQAGHAERRRIERDLHDGAQQRLVALRVRLDLVGESLQLAEERAMVERLGAEVQAAIDELRNLAHGVYPQLLTDHGLATALRAVARRSDLHVMIRDGGVGRHSDALETTAYFCCLECLQNVGKHAGAEATVTISLGERDGHVTFCVADDGPGFDPAAVDGGAGLQNLADRVAAIGGTLRIDTRLGHGTRITGILPSD
jgi:signal transduction histidine kinase